MPKSSYAMIDGVLAEKTGPYTAVRDGENYYLDGIGRWCKEGAPPESPGFMVMPDIQPYRSVVTGEVINSRSAHRAHLREHGLLEVGNERIKPPTRTETFTRGLREELIARIKG